jgi:hypothetical protein
MKSHHRNNNQVESPDNRSCWPGRVALRRLRQEALQVGVQSGLYNETLSQKIGTAGAKNSQEHLPNLQKGGRSLSDSDNFRSLKQEEGSGIEGAQKDMGQG